MTSYSLLPDWPNLPDGLILGKFSADGEYLFEWGRKEFAPTPSPASAASPMA